MYILLWMFNFYIYPSDSLFPLGTPSQGGGHSRRYSQPPPSTPHVLLPSCPPTWLKVYLSCTPWNLSHSLPMSKPQFIYYYSIYTLVQTTLVYCTSLISPHSRHQVPFYPYQDLDPYYTSHAHSLLFPFHIRAGLQFIKETKIIKKQ